jgi:hypothetical protein
MEYKCPLYESSQFTCDRPAVHLVNGTAICAYHALRLEIRVNRGNASKS